ncbi:MAG TPA: cytochrome c [Deltaproteobacteria bacterium]|nr:cytochrome c [Deltaproteobacteria bacterium]
MVGLSGYILSVIVLLAVCMVPTPSLAVVDGKALYMRWCSQCHGEDGRGDGVNSTPDMSINPRDHTDATFMSTKTDEQLEEVIRYGGAGIAKSPLMPPWRKTLTDEEIKALVKYLRALCRCQYRGIVSHKKLRRIDPDFR